MKKHPYEKLVLEIFYFNQEDIVTESPSINTDAEGNDEDIFNLSFGNFV